MQSSMIQERIKALLRELLLRKMAVAVTFSIISIAVLCIGIIIPKQYVTQAVLYADFKNIIKPLLADDTSVTTVDQAQVAKETLNTRRLIEEVGKKAGIVDDSQGRLKQEQALANLREDIKVYSMGDNHIQISYSHTDPEKSYNVVNVLVEVYLRESEEAKRQESADAFAFIDDQVEEYKSRLSEADAKLEEYQKNNRDGTKESVDLRIAELRGNVEELKFVIDDSDTRKRSVARELSNESQFVERRYKSTEAMKRLAASRKQLDSLLVSFTETHPDVVSLKMQIAEMESDVQKDEVAGISAFSGAGSTNRSAADPLYEELRKKKAEIEVSKKSALRRLKITEALLAKEYERLQRVIGRSARLQELTRDYNVTRGIYEDMLSSREKARLSMTLDKSGQGVSYRVQEPPAYPILPSGLRLMHFFFLGPIVGLMIPLGLLYAFIELDPRVRMASTIQGKLKLPLLAIIPHSIGPLSKRFARRDLYPIICLFAAVVAVYVAAIIYFSRVAV